MTITDWNTVAAWAFLTITLAIYGLRLAVKRVCVGAGLLACAAADLAARLVTGLAHHTGETTLADAAALCHNWPLPARGGRQ